MQQRGCLGELNDQSWPPAALQTALVTTGLRSERWLGRGLGAPERRPSSAAKDGVSGEDCRTTLPPPSAELCRVDHASRKEVVREFRSPPALASSAGFTATLADAPRSPRCTLVLLAMTVEMRVAAPNRGEKAAPKPALGALAHGFFDKNHGGDIGCAATKLEEVCNDVTSKTGRHRT
jgi:hypothetical protein